MHEPTRPMGSGQGAGRTSAHREHMAGLLAIADSALTQYGHSGPHYKMRPRSFNSLLRYSRICLHRTHYTLFPPQLHDPIITLFCHHFFCFSVPNIMFSRIASFLAVLGAARIAVAAPMPDPEPEIELLRRQGLANVYSSCTVVSQRVLTRRLSLFSAPLLTRTCHLLPQPNTVRALQRDLV